MVKSTLEGYKPLAQAELKDTTTGWPLLVPPCWAALIIAHGYAYLRGKGRVVCVDLLR